MSTPSQQRAVTPRLWLVRHGQTDWNAVGRIQGQTPTELNAVGRAEAVALADQLVRAGRGGRRFVACYASDLPRAAQTAEILARPFGLSVQTRVDLRERNFGPYEGLFPDAIRAARVAAGLSPSGDLADWTGMPDVESNDQLWSRSAAALHEISAIHAHQAPCDILVVTHGGVMARAIYRTLGIPDGTPRHFPLSNGIIAVLEASSSSGTESFRLLTFADLRLLGGESPALDTATMPTQGVRG
jgi:broad specificity phosphatase PhoE